VTQEGAVNLTDKITFIDDYMATAEGKFSKLTLIESDQSCRWHSITTPKSEVSSALYTEKVTVPRVEFNLTIDKIEARVYEGQDFCFESSEGIDQQVKESIVQSFDQGNTMNNLRNTFADNSQGEDEPPGIFDFGQIQDFFNSEKSSESGSVKRTMINEDQGRVRKKKKCVKRYFQFEMNMSQLSFMDLTDSVEGIDSQIGFTIEKLALNEVRSHNEVKQIFWFDNDFDAHKNLCFKVIFLQNKSQAKEKCMELYFLSESIRISISHLSITFAYLLVQPVILFYNNEMRKDQHLFEQIYKQRSTPVDLSKSISMSRIERQIEGMSEPVWKIDDDNLPKTSGIFIKYMHIRPFKIKINYKSDTLNIVNLYKGDLLNYITNVVDISELRIKIREYKVNSKIRIEVVTKMVIEFYLNDLVYNQKLNLLASVYPIRVTINIMKAFANLFQSPMNSYMNEGYLLFGIYDGFTTFLNQITHEFSDVGSKLLNYINSWQRFINQ